MTGYAEYFARNCRMLREEMGMTQRELARKLGFSEKTVSKWECGASVPTVDVLFAIAKIFRTSVDALFRPDKTYLLGIDGGGTKTDLLLADAQGNAIRELRVGGCNPVDIGFSAAAELLKNAIHEICGEIPFSSVSLFAGIAGGTSADMRGQLHSFFESFHFRAFDNDSDNVNAIAAGLGKRDGITVTLGTGICAYVQQNRRHSRIAGWGYLIDNGGSGYNFGRDALNAYFCALDGTGPATSLTQLIDARCPGGAQKVMEYIYGGGKKAVASFAPTVFEAVETGDETAIGILNRNIRAVVYIIETAAKRFSEAKIPVVLVGGLTNRRVLLQGIRQTIRTPERFEFHILDGRPVNGAVMLAGELAVREEQRC